MIMPNPGSNHVAALHRKRILIVEDEAIVALMLETEIADAGADVVGPAFDLASAVQLAATPLDAAVLDINLGGEKVFPAARVLKDRGVPMIFASANCDELDGQGNEFAGYPRISKPLSIRPLLDHLAEMVDSISG